MERVVTRSTDMLEFWELRCSVMILGETMHVGWKIKFRVCHALSLLPEDLPSPHYRFVSLAETFNMAATNCGSFSTFI